ncbi:uncharacterized protein H6S33_012753 [Morchella sextelata]|uniref:uncharacterized protein n=1 Tax=Morchella sextelata TaxID=1174677 RepID=UPI001D0436DA|nr:uncharacterized protein H6S33_012753 [Morchella sextelata]KAH0609267.1 hypothetical protein H6S33_012753 [Morchella sextelata]
MSELPPSEFAAAPETKKSFPKGPVVLGKDGKPFRDWTKMHAKRKSSSPAAAEASAATIVPITLPSDCPPDVETLGRSTWTLLHTIAATYPSSATPTQQTEMKKFITLFSRVYPCWVCAEDFQEYLKEPENKLKVMEEEKGRGHLSGRSEFGLWMCKAHNNVNVKLGKSEFDCSKWEERWRTGWKDGRCD